MLKDNQDAFGHQLYDFFKGRPVVEVVERNDGLIDPSLTNPKYYLSEYKAWSRREKRASKYVKGRVLDVGCGGGRWSLYLQKKGHDVLGIDTSPLCVKVCKQRGVRNVMVKSISDVDSRLGNFDTILMIGNNFGLFGSLKQARRLLRRFYNVTGPNACIIAESVDIYRPPLDPVHRQYHVRNRRLGRMPGQVRIRIRYRNYATDWFDYLLAAKPEMKMIVKGTGWRVKKFIKSAKGPAYIGIMEKEAPRL